MTAFVTIFGRFPKILQNLLEGHTNVVEHFPKFPMITEDRWRLILLKHFEEDPKMFWSYTNEFRYKDVSMIHHRIKVHYLRNKLDISEIVDTFTSEQVSDVVSYEFYEWCIFQ